jgi:hypothetical protein
MYDIIYDVRSLVAKYGYKDVYQTLENCMKVDYEFLRGHFSKDVGYYGVPLQSPGTCTSSVYAYKVNEVNEDNVQIPMVYNNDIGESESVGGPSEADTTSYVQTDIASYFQGYVEPIPEIIPADPDPTTVKNLVVEAPVRKVIKKVSAESVLPTVKVETVTSTNPVISTNPAPSENVEADNESIGAEKKEGKYRDPKEMKAWQKEQEDKKRAELAEAGINGYDLMTVENMKQWVEVEGKTYSAVARDYLGIPDNQVSAFGKKNGIQSSVSKRRTMTMVAKMNKK